MTSIALEPKTTAAHPWSFVTSHALALLELARDPDITIRALATRLALTERHTHRVVTDLVEAGYVSRTRIGRRNRYEIDPSQQMRTPALESHEVGDLLQLLAA